MPVAYDVVRYAGAAYLLYLAWKTFRSDGTVLAPTAGLRHHPVGVMFRQGLLTNLLNPKMALFVLALFPQFVQPEAGSVAVQIMVLATVLNAIGLVVNGIVILMASRLGRLFSGRGPLAAPAADAAGDGVRGPRREARLRQPPLISRLLMAGRSGPI